MEKIIDQIIRWLLVGILVFSAITLFVVYQQNYIEEVLAANATPLSIVIGLTAIAVAIYEKKG